MPPSTSPGQTATTETTHITERTPPVIKDFQWKPTRVVNGKVYDATVSLTIQSSRPLTTVSAFFDGYAPTIPAGAYPAESQRTLTLTSSPNSSQSYSAQVTDLRGGKAYLLSVSAQDSNGEKNTAAFQTPYVREFENIGKGLDIHVGSYYYPWKTSPSIHTPLLGAYNPDREIITKHIDWATGHGIQFLLWSWWGPDSPEDTVLRKDFLGNPLIDEIKFCILYESEGRFGKSVKGRITVDSDLLKQDFDYLSRYFEDTRYLQVDDKPVVFMYLSRDYVGDMKKTLAEIRSKHDPWLMGDFVYWDIGRGFQDDLVTEFDAVSAYTFAFGNPTVMKKDGFIARVMQRYEVWKEYADSNGIDFIPMAMPGFNDDAKGGTYPNINRDVGWFGDYLHQSLQFLSKPRMAFITSFNEWHEDTQIEPATDYGFDYLKVVKQEIA
jgi:glycoprotein endo-alpha-1,2-mannosidase